MSTRLLAAAWREVRPVLIWQAVGILVLTVLFGAIFGMKAGLAALVGSVIGFFGTAYVMIALLRRGMRPGGGSIAGVFGTWLIKVTLTLGLLFLALQSEEFPPLPLLAGFSGSLLAYWLSMVVGRENNAGNFHGSK